MSRAAREAAARIAAQRDSDAVESRRERQRQGSTVRVDSARGRSDVDHRLGRSR